MVFIDAIMSVLMLIGVLFLALFKRSPILALLVLGTALCFLHYTMPLGMVIIQLVALYYVVTRSGRFIRFLQAHHHAHKTPAAPQPMATPAARTTPYTPAPSPAAPAPTPTEPRWENDNEYWEDISDQPLYPAPEETPVMDKAPQYLPAVRAQPAAATPVLRPQPMPITPRKSAEFAPQFTPITGIFGQAASIQVINQRLKTALTFRHADLPKALASFLLAGPSGVGKTETAKAIAQAVYGNPHQIARFDCNTSGNAEGSQWRAFGPPRGYLGSDKGGELTQAIKGLGGRCVILLDEIEKGSTQLFDGLLQALDEGYMQDQSFGERIPLQDTLIVMTTNLIGQDQNLSQMHEDDLRGLLIQKGLRREFVGRIGNILCYSPLDHAAHTQIIRKRYFEHFAPRIAHNLSLAIGSMTDLLVDHMATEVEAQKDFGARGIDRWIEQNLLPMLTEQPAEVLHSMRQEVWLWDLTPPNEAPAHVHLVTAFEAAQGRPVHQLSSDMVQYTFDAAALLKETYHGRFFS